MKWRLLFLAAAIALLLAGCGAEITEGEVVEKEFSPAHITVVTVPIVVSNGKSCTTTLVPFTYYYSDAYYITIAAIKDGEEKQARFRVTKEVYDATEIGAEFIYSETMEPIEPEYTRERIKKEE